MAMSDTTQRPTPLMLAAPAGRVSLTETWWGYVIRNERVITSGRRMLTVVAGLLAAGFAMSSLVLWIAPATAFPGEVILLKGAASSLMAMIALLFARLATEDAVIEIQVDLRRAEIREVSRRIGDRTHLLGRYGFEDIGGLFFDRTGPGRLVARYRNTSHLITIADGSGPALERIRDRMGRDVVGLPVAI